MSSKKLSVLTAIRQSWVYQQQDWAIKVNVKYNRGALSVPIVSTNSHFTMGVLLRIIITTAQPPPVSRIDKVELLLLASYLNGRVQNELISNKHLCWKEGEAQHSVMVMIHDSACTLKGIRWCNRTQAGALILSETILGKTFLRLIQLLIYCPWRSHKLRLKHRAHLVIIYVKNRQRHSQSAQEIELNRRNHV